MSLVTRTVAATPGERNAALPGDGLVPADVVMDRGFTLDAAPAELWPWLVQVGKGRAGWYLPRSVERCLPPSRRGVRRIVPELQAPRVGDTIADWGGRDATLTVTEVVAERLILYRSQRGRVALTWAVVLSELPGGGTRVHSRVRLGPVRHVWLAEHVGGAFDLLTLLGLALGLRERLAGSPRRADRRK